VIVAASGLASLKFHSESVQSLYR